MEQRLLLTIDQAARLTGVSRSTARRLIARGEWPYLKIGASTRIPLAQLHAWIAARTVSEPGQPEPVPQVSRDDER